MRCKHISSRMVLQVSASFLRFFRDETDLITVLRDEFNVDAANALADRAKVAAVICSWKDTVTKAKRQSEVEAEMNSREWTKPIPAGDYVQLRKLLSNCNWTCGRSGDAFERILGKEITRTGKW